jgi:hypothetical protein
MDSETWIYIPTWFLYKLCFSLSACGARQMSEEWESFLHAFLECLSVSKPEPAIFCGGLLRLWETPATFARKSVHLDPGLRSTFINRHYCRQTWIMPLFKLITTLILQRTLAMVLNCCKILVVIYFNLFKITVNHGLLCYFKYYSQRPIMTLYGNAALLLFYILLLAYQYPNSLLISYEKLGSLISLLKLCCVFHWYV